MPRRNVITLAVLVAFACEPSRRRTPDDTLVVLIESTMSTADPRYAVTGYDRKLTNLVATGLTIVDSPTLEPRLGLASRVEPMPGVVWDLELPPGAPVAEIAAAYRRRPGIVAAEVDGDRVVRLRLAQPVEQPELAAALAPDPRVVPRPELAYDVWIRDDARFSDGSPVLARDVAGTYRDLIAPGSDSLFHKGFAERFASIEIVDDHRVRFHLRAPLATFLTDIDFGIISYAAGRPEPGQTIGAGPYMIREITSSLVHLVANPHHHGERPKVANVEIRFVRDQSARLLMLVGGSADLIQNAARLDLVDEVVDRPRVHLATGPSVFLTYLLLNNADPILADRRVRQAIALAIDRPAIVSAKFGGRARLATGLLPPNHWAYAEVRRYERDLAEARRLLDEAGRTDPDGDGPRPRFSLIYKTSSDAFRVAVARAIAAQLAGIGIDVEVRSFEFATFFADVKKGVYQMASMQTAEITEPDFYYTYFHSSWIPSADNPDGYNRWRYVNPEVDRLTVAGRRELDREKRKAIYAELQRIIADDVPIIPLFHEDNVVLMNADVDGYTITPNARLIGLRDAIKRAR
jgi:peptide/nickel transport system substrate-binding protein